MSPFRLQTIALAVTLLGLPAVGAAEVKPFFFSSEPVLLNVGFTGNGWGLKPWGDDFWAASAFQWPANAVPPGINAKQAGAPPPQFQQQFLPPMMMMPPMMMPPMNPMFPGPGGGGGGGGAKGYGASTGGDYPTAGVLLHGNYAKIYGTPKQSQQPNQSMMMPMSPYQYPMNPFNNPFAAGPFLR